MARLLTSSPAALVALIAALVLGGCASGPPKRVFPPEARVQELQVNGTDAQLLLRVQSFSTVPSEVQAYALTLDIADAPAARLEGTAAATVLPQAAEVIPVPVQLDAAARARVQHALERGTVVRYRLHGTITVEPHGRAYPIDYSSALSPVPGLAGVLR